MTQESTRYRIRDLLLNQYVAGPVYTSATKAERQLETIMFQDKSIQGDRFVVVAISPDGSFMEPSFLVAAPEVEVMGDP